VLTPPDDLDEALLRSVYERDWGLTVAEMAYRPVGWGSHHWDVVDPTGTRWFGTLDELARKRRSQDEPLDVAFGRLCGSLGAAGALRDLGHAYAVAPVLTRAHEPAVRLGDRYAVTLYPYAEGESFTWGEFSTPEHRSAVVDIVIAIHTAPAVAREGVHADDFAIAHRDELEAGLAGTGDADCGPYARPVAELLAEYEAPIRRLLARYDALVDESRAQARRAILTHGEPHPGNTMLGPGGWLLIDWETALVAPPERDLWGLDPGDGSVLRAYAEGTGVTPLPSMIELYRIRWDISDIAVDVGRFRRSHSGNLDDEKSWEILRAVVKHIAATSSPM
jgi:aminoglycoside phosphotransferase (APT) family kinase protein